MTVRYISLLLVTAVLFFSCKKNDPAGPGPDNSNDDKLKDTVLSYARDLYLWNTQIPADFNARSYADPDEIMNAIQQYSIEPGFAEPVDVFSFAMKKAEYNNLISGVATDFGFNAFFFADDDLRIGTVEEQSAAGKAGLRRGWRFVKVAGSDDISVSNISFLQQNIYRSASTSFTFLKPDSTTVDITLTSDTYQEDPIQLDTIYQAGSRKAGYVVYNTFLGDTGAVIREMESIFNRFAGEGVTDVVVDLRYNGGGYVSLQETLANYLVKTAASGSVMMNQVFNSNYSSLNETILFRKRGSLNINNLYFIVSDNTASASELLINNMKPYMNVKLVGPETTYGKPVGYFPLGVGDWYILPVSFRSTNGRNEGNYFDGIEVDKFADDGLDKDWGDVTEPALASVLAHVSTGTFAPDAASPGLNSTLESMKNEGNQRLNRRMFKGAIAGRRQ